MERYELSAAGLEEPIDERLTRAELSRIEGVSRVDPDRESRSVTVEAEPELHPRLERAIAVAGYEAPPEHDRATPAPSEPRELERRARELDREAERLSRRAREFDREARRRREGPESPPRRRPQYKR